MKENLKTVSELCLKQSLQTKVFKNKLEINDKTTSIMNTKRIFIQETTRPEEKLSKVRHLPKQGSKNEVAW